MAQFTKTVALGGSIQIGDGVTAFATFAHSSAGHRLYERLIRGIAAAGDTLIDGDTQIYIVGDVGQIAP